MSGPPLAGIERGALRVFVPTSWSSETKLSEVDLSDGVAAGELRLVGGGAFGMAIHRRNELIETRGLRPALVQPPTTEVPSESQSITRALMSALGRQAGDEEVDLARDRYRVVGEALVVAADQRGVDRRFHPVRPVLGEQDPEDPPA